MQQLTVILRQVRKALLETPHHPVLNFLYFFQFLLSFRSDPCQPPVHLPPCTGLASVQKGRARVSEHGVRASSAGTSGPAGVRLLHFAAAISTVHHTSGRPAAMKSCEGLEHPGRVEWSWMECSKLSQLSQVTSGLWVQLDLGEKKNIFNFTAESYSSHNL